MNEFIKKIIVHALDKSSGKRTQEIRIIFNFLSEVDLSEVNGPIVVEQTKKCRKAAWLSSHAALCGNSSLGVVIYTPSSLVYCALSADADKENLSLDSTCIKVHESANGGGKNGR